MIQPIPEIVLRDKVGSTRMQTTSEEARHEEVTKCPHSHELDDDHIEDSLNHEVD